MSNNPQEPPRDVLTVRFEADNTRVIRDRAGNEVVLPALDVQPNNGREQRNYQMPQAHVTLNGQRYEVGYLRAQDALLKSDTSIPALVENFAASMQVGLSQFKRLTGIDRDAPAPVIEVEAPSHAIERLVQAERQRGR